MVAHSLRSYSKNIFIGTWFRRGTFYSSVHRHSHSWYANNSYKCLHKTLWSLACCQKWCLTFPLTAPHKHSRAPVMNNRKKVAWLTVCVDAVRRESVFMNQDDMTENPRPSEPQPLSTLELSFNSPDPHNHSIHPPPPPLLTAHTYRRSGVITAVNYDKLTA